MLPGPFQAVLHLNPIYYMIETMRFALIGHSDGSPLAGFAIVLVLAAAVVLWALALLRSGYKIRT
jgi:ABC-2 type transport system permease protein